MITKINAKGFKALEICQEIEAKTIFIGNQGTGKSARSMALTLAILGYIPGTDKTNPGILANFSNDEALYVGFEAMTSPKNKVAFSRGWIRDKVTQVFIVDRKKVTKAKFAAAMASAGAPSIFDLAAFNDLSDTKKLPTCLICIPRREVSTS